MNVLSNRNNLQLKSDPGSLDAAHRVRIGIVGLNFGRHIVGELAAAPANAFIQLGAVCDLELARAKEVAAKVEVPAYLDIERLLADPTLEAVGLFTGPVGRAALIERVIRAGKHVMTTKPFEIDPDRALQVLAEAKRLGRIVHLNSPAPLEPLDLRQVRLWREKYQLGRPIGCRREVWVSYREQSHGGWCDDPDRCPVAPIYRLGIYLINDMVRLLGEVESVQVMHSRIFTGRPTPDNAQLAMKFKNGALATVFASFCIDDGQFYSNSMTLNFENGTVYRNVGPLSYGRAQDDSVMAVVARTGSGTSVIEHANIAAKSGTYQWEAFYKAVRGLPLEGEELTPRQIVEGVRIIAAMARSEKSGRAEEIT